MNPAFYDHSTCLSEVEKAYTPAQKQAPYDKKNQLITVDFEHNTKPGNDYNFTYDPVGNRQSFQHAFGTEQYTYANNCNKLDRKQVGNGYVDYLYDDNGNLTNEKQYMKNGNAVKELQEKSYKWNAENRLLQIAIVKSPNNPNEKLQTNLISFTYDHLGQRVSKSVNGKTTYYLYQGIQVIAECDASGKIIDKFIYGHNKVGRVTDNKITYHYEDVISSVNVVADAQGNFSQMNIQDAWGNILYSEGSDKNDYTFAGKEKDESGLFYFVARYYDSTLGRFISRDAFRGNVSDPQSLHGYVYSRNNPLRYIDPTGNSEKEVSEDSKKNKDDLEKHEENKTNPEDSKVSSRGVQAPSEKKGDVEKKAKENSNNIDKKETDKLNISKEDKDLIDKYPGLNGKSLEELQQEIKNNANENPDKANAAFKLLLAKVSSSRATGGSSKEEQKYNLLIAGGTDDIALKALKEIKYLGAIAFAEIKETAFQNDPKAAKQAYINIMWAVKKESERKGISVEEVAKSGYIKSMFNKARIGKKDYYGKGTIERGTLYLGIYKASDRSAFGDKPYLKNMVKWKHIQKEMKFVNNLATGVHTGQIKNPGYENFGYDKDMPILKKQNPGFKWVKVSGVWFGKKGD